MSNLTISLTGSEVRAEFYGTNAWLRNDGTSTVYASKSPSVTAGADGVVSVPAGGSAPVFDAHGTVFLIGTGSVFLIGSDYSENPFKSSAQSGGSGADEVARAAIEAHAGNSTIHLTAEQLSVGVAEAKTYADSKDEETLAAAKEYADSIAGSGGVSQSYVDEKDGETLAAAQTYADSAAEAAASAANAYTDEHAAKVSHTHTVSDISDFPEIPSAGVTEGQLNSAISNHNTDGAAHAGIFAAESHTHSVSEITDFPEALPANGGNADTVGNVAVSSSNEVGLRKISAGTDDLTVGTSALETGAIYLVYE